MDGRSSKAPRISGWRGVCTRVTWGGEGRASLAKERVLEGFAEFGDGLLEFFGYGAPVLVAVSFGQRGREDLELRQVRDLPPAAVFQDVREEFGFASLLALDGGFEFLEDTEIGGEEVAAELADDDVGFVEFLKDARFPGLSGCQGVVGPWVNQAVALHQLKIFA